MFGGKDETYIHIYSFMMLVTYYMRFLIYIIVKVLFTIVKRIVPAILWQLKMIM